MPNCDGRVQTVAAWLGVLFSGSEMGGVKDELILMTELSWLPRRLWSRTAWHDVAFSLLVRCR